MGRALSPSLQVERILREQDPGETGAPQFERVEAAVLFSDIVGSTSFFEERGDDAGMAMVERHNRLLFPEVERNGGTVIKTIGDAIMASYPTATEAVRSAVAMQMRLKEHNATQPPDERIVVRIGINHGTVIQRNHDLFGDVVNAAARVESLARSGMILVSAAVREQIPREAHLDLISFDAVRVKGKQEPLEVFLVRWDPDAPTASPGTLPLPRTGDVLGERFEIGPPLGAGGMGQVFEARDRALDERLALKFIHADLARDPDTVTRFKQEVKLARSITHRNICRIHEFLQLDGHTFLSMELVRGISLAALLERTAPLPVARATGIAAAVCSGLQEAHGLGITHRDLKPANVMIEQDTERVVIMDFGIARLGSAAGDAAEGLVVGTPAYMSPEQAQGGAVGPASDLYAVGCMLYEMLTGKPPHLAETPMAVAIKQVTEQPAPPANINPDVPADIQQVILRCLRKEPRERFGDARELAVALVGERTTALAAPAPRPRWRRWQPAALGALAAVGLALVVLWFVRGPARPRATGRVRPLVSSLQVEHNVRWSPRGEFFAFLKDGDVWMSPFPDVKLFPVTTGAGALGEPDLADLSWGPGRRLFFPVGGPRGPVLVHAPAMGGTPVELLPGVAGADPSPDGERIALTEKNELGFLGIAVCAHDGTGRKTLLEGDASASYMRPRWSPDGTRLALVVHRAGYDTTRDIGLLEIESGKLRMLTRDGFAKRANNVDPAWSPGGDWIVYASKRTGTMSLWAVPARGGESVPITQGATVDQRGPDVSPDGGRILFGTARHQLDLSVFSLADSQARPLTGDAWGDRFPVWSPDGSRIAFRSQRNSDDPAQRSIVLQDPDGGNEREIPGPAGLRDFDWCGTRRLIFASTAGDERRLGLLDMQDSSVHLLSAGFHRVWAPVADRTCSRVVFCGRETPRQRRRLWTVDPARPVPRPLHDQPGRETYPSLSPDGRWLAYRWAPSHERMAEAELRVVPAEPAGAAHRTVTSHPSFRRSRRRIRWSSDGRWLFYMEATPRGAALWKVPARGGRPERLALLDDIHTFDFDLDPDGNRLVYARAVRFGDIFVLEGMTW